MEAYFLTLKMAAEVYFPFEGQNNCSPGQLNLTLNATRAFISANRRSHFSWRQNIAGVCGQYGQLVFFGGAAILESQNARNGLPDAKDETIFDRSN